MTELLVIGRVGKAHGLRGEVYVHLITDRVERLATGSALRTRGATLVVQAARAQQDRWLVNFEGVTDRSGAEALTGTELLAEPIVDPDAVWVHDLIGSRVIERDGTERGRCVGVIANPAHDILELDTGGLVPSVFVVSCIAGVTTIDPPAGLFEV